MELEKALDKRIFWLERFLASSQSFLQRLDREPSIEELDTFEQNRNSLLKIIDNLNKEISLIYAETFKFSAPIPSALQDKFRFYKQRKESILKEIEAVDLLILDRISITRNEIAMRLKALNKGRTVLSKYRRQGSSSEKLDTML